MRLRFKYKQIFISNINTVTIYEAQLKVPPLCCIGSLTSKFGVVLIEICNVLLLVLKIMVNKCGQSFQ